MSAGPGLPIDQPAVPRLAPALRVWGAKALRTSSQAAAVPWVSFLAAGSSSLCRMFEVTFSKWG